MIVLMKKGSEFLATRNKLKLKIIRMKFLKVSASIIFLLFMTSLAVGQSQLTHNIKGQVIEKETGLPLTGANVYIRDSDPLLGVVTDIDGYYVFQDLPVGRYRLACSYVGYEPQVTGSLLLTTGKELFYEFQLEEAMNAVEVEIVAVAETDVQTAELATISVQKFDAALTSRFAGSRSDVARMAAGFAGVSANDDSRNDIVIRGNSPSGLLWRLNGIDIPNPSHFGALGATGGPVSMLNNNQLTNSIFMTGAFPANYGNALSGVFDLTMRKGNRDKLEGLFAVSFNGFEGGLEGPLGRSGGTYLINYRYSVIDLVNKVFGGGTGGATGTGDAIPRYQDLSFHIHLPTKKFGTFALFGLGGNSGIEFLSDIADSESPNLFSDSNQDLYYNSDSRIVALTNKHYYSDKSYGKLSVSYSSAGVNTVLDTVSVDLAVVPVYRDDSNQGRLRVAYDFKSKLNKKHTIIAGANFNNFNFNFLDSVRTNATDFRILRDYDDNASLSQAYAQWQYRHNDRLTTNVGFFGQYFGFNETSTLEPRLNLRYSLAPNLEWTFGAGRHSKVQDFQLYLVTTRLDNGQTVNTNQDLSYTTSDQVVTGFKWNFSDKWNLKSEFYLQSLSDVPVERHASSYSALNLGADFNVPSTDSLINAGTGKNYGVELTLERTFSEGFYLLSTLSIYESIYTGSNGVKYNTAFGNGYVGNVLAGKEFSISEKLTLGFDIKTTMAGGKRYTPIDLAASVLEGEAVLQEGKAFSERFDDYFRTDIQFTVRYNMKRLSQSWSIDLQNAFNNQNVFGQSFDVRNQEVDLVYQLGFFPVIEYKFTF